MKQLKEYCDKKEIQYQVIDENIIQLADKKFFVLPNSEVFNNALTLKRKYKGDFDKFIIKLGAWYFMFNADETSQVQLDLFKQIGEKKQSGLSNDSFLGCHTKYDLLKGIGNVGDWIAKAKFFGMKHLGIVDFSTLSGVVKFQNGCKKNLIKPILGATFKVTREGKNMPYLVKCYVKNKIGWKSLIRLNYESNVNHLSFIPEKVFWQINGGLIKVLTPENLKHSDITPEILKVTNFYTLDILKYHNQIRQAEYEKNLGDFLRDKKMEPISATDAYVLDEYDSYARSVLMTIRGENTHIAENQFLKNKTQYYHEVCGFFAEEQLAGQFILRALRNEKALSDKCKYLIEKEKHFPEYTMTSIEAKEYDTNLELFDGLIEKGLKANVIPKGKKEIYQSRIAYEREVIIAGGYVDYFLVVRDMIRFAKEDDIMIGEGRGSAVASLIIYLLGITQIDPIQFNLPFDRFLNMIRIKKSTPDIDVDFQSSKRDRVIRYLQLRYGKNRVCGIGTHQQLGIKSLVTHLAKMSEMDKGDANIISSKINDKTKTYADLIRDVKRKSKLKDWVKANWPLINQIPLLLGSPDHYSTHASGIIVSNNDLEKNIPLRRDKHEDAILLFSEWDGVDMEDVGYLKLDILGVTQLDKISYILAKIKEIEGVDVVFKKNEFNDSKVIEHFAKGYTGDVFQFSSDLATEYLKLLQPTEMLDVIHAIALIRPGAADNDFHFHYANRKNGYEEIEYLKGLEKITEYTKGLIIYQEQVMAACVEVAGFTMAQADDIRKAMGKKKSELLNSYQIKFVEGGSKKGYDEKYLIKLFEMLKAYSNYGFNKAHSVGYAALAYRCMYLKVYYPIYFWAAAFSFNKRQENISKYVAEILDVGEITIAPADINYSDININIDYEKKHIIWNLSSIAFLGVAGMEKILEIREQRKGKQFHSFLDFLNDVATVRQVVNSRIIKNLILAGCFDELEDIGERKSNRCRLLKEASKRYKLNLKPYYINNQIKPDYFWEHQQKIISGYAFINYEAIVRGFFRNLPYPILTNLHDPQKRENKYMIAGYVVQLEEKLSAKNKLFGIIKLDINYQFIDLLIWEQELLFLNRQYKTIDKSIICCAVRVKKSYNSNNNSLFLDSSQKINILAP